MHVSRLALHSYRNYGSLQLDFNKGLTILVGPNATGKTNCIEAIQLLTAGESFRNPKWADLIEWGEEEAHIEAEFLGPERTTTVEWIISTQKPRSFKINGDLKRRSNEVSKILPSVVFTPDDLELIKGPAEKRRTLIDSLGEQLSKTYGSIRREYMRTLRQKNAALKERRTSTELIDAINQRLAHLGSQLTSHRVRLLSRVNKEINMTHTSISERDDLSLEYQTKTGTTDLTECSIEEIRQMLTKGLETRKDEEIGRQVALIGPHKDDIGFYLDGRSARQYGSQGQQRTIALAWKLAEIEVISSITKKRPVLLLDDVMSELDEDRRSTLTNLIKQSTQAVVTTTNIEYFDPSLLEEATIIELGR